MSRGPLWTEDEARICRYMWEHRESGVPDTVVDESIAKVLVSREAPAIRIFRKRNGMVRPKKKVTVALPAKIELPMKEKERSDSLPDIGEQVGKILEKQTLMESTLWCINMKCGELVELEREKLQLWKDIDARSKAAGKS